MADNFQFDSNAQDLKARSAACEPCEAMLADVLDGTLSAADQAGFDSHIAHCAACSEMLGDARRGAAWLEMLRTPRPEPPVALLERILAQTSGSQGLGSQISPLGNVMPLPPVYGLPAQPQVFAAGRVFAFPRRGSFGHIVNVMMQPRLAMTAAMAFFSIALTMNLTGVRVRDLNANTLRPSSLTRDFYAANNRVVQYYAGLRVVNEFEARVHDLRSDSDGSDSPQAAPDSRPAEQRQAPRPAPGGGTSKRETPGGTLRTVAGGFDVDEHVSPFSELQPRGSREVRV